MKFKIRNQKVKARRLSMLVREAEAPRLKSTMKTIEKYRAA